MHVDNMFQFQSQPLVVHYLAAFYGHYTHSMLICNRVVDTGATPPKQNLWLRP